MKTFIKRFGFSSDAGIQLLPQSGSNRKFYRIIEDNKTAVLMQSAIGGNRQDTEFDNYIELNKFLREINIGVPEIYIVDKKNRLILEEDIGDLSLQKAVVGADSIRVMWEASPDADHQGQETFPTPLQLYKSVIDTLLRMQILGGKRMHLCPCLRHRKFDYKALRWETNYFTKYFLNLYCGLNVGVQNFEPLQKEFHILASKLVNNPFYFMHRDFQSQNIFIKDEKIRIIDFQSARQGLLAYDLAALLKDAYVENSVGTQYIEPLLNYYLEKGREQACLFPTDKFRRTFLYAGLQRNMQALGAFSYLSLVKKKMQFKQYICPCLRYLKSGLSETHEFPELTKIVKIQ